MTQCSSKIIVICALIVRTHILYTVQPDLRKCTCNMLPQQVGLVSVFILMSLGPILLLS